MSEDAPLEYTPISEPSLELDLAIRENLKNAAKWGRFLAIVGFVGIGLTVVLGLFFSALLTMLSNGLYPDDMPSPYMLPPMFYTLLYLVIAVIYFFPVLYLYRFSTKMLSALSGDDQLQLSESFRNLKSMLRFMGILTIVILSLYGLIIIFMLLGGLGAFLM